MKKYLLIGEVANLLNISQSRLRYIEKIINLKLLKIRGRRYYKASDIKKITEHNKIIPYEIEQIVSNHLLNSSSYLPDLEKLNHDKTNTNNQEIIAIPPVLQVKTLSESNSDSSINRQIKEDIEATPHQPGDKEVLQLDFFAHFNAKSRAKENKKSENITIEELDIMVARLKDSQKKLSSLVGE